MLSNHTSGASGGAGNNATAISTTSMPPVSSAVLNSRIRQSNLGIGIPSGGAGTSTNASTAVGYGYGYSASTGAIAGLHQEVKLSSQEQEKNSGHNRDIAVNSQGMQYNGLRGV